MDKIEEKVPEEPKTHKSIFFIKCELDEFISNFPKHPLCDVVVYSEMERKIKSKDLFKANPTSDIVNFAISKKISQFLISKKQFFLYYHLNSLEKERLNRIAQMIEKLEDTTIHLFVTEQKDYNSAKKYVDNVHLVQNLFI